MNHHETNTHEALNAPVVVLRYCSIPEAFWSMKGKRDTLKRIYNSFFLEMVLVILFTVGILSIDSRTPDVHLS